eukprot:gene5947-8196_t
MKTRSGPMDEELLEETPAAANNDINVDVTNNDTMLGVGADIEQKLEITVSSGDINNIDDADMKAHVVAAQGDDTKDENEDEKDEKHKKKKKKSKDRERDGRKHRRSDREKDEDDKSKDKSTRRSFDRGDDRKDRDRSKVAESVSAESFPIMIDNSRTDGSAASAGISTSHKDDRDAPVKEKDKEIDKKEREKDIDKDKKGSTRDKDRERKSGRDYDDRDHRDRDRGDREKDRPREGRDRSYDRYRGSRGDSRVRPSRDSRDRGDRDRRDRDRDDRYRSSRGERRRSRSRSGSPKRRRSPSPRRSDKRRRSRERRSASGDRNKPTEDKANTESKAEEKKDEFKLLTLRDVLEAAPGISMPEAVLRLNAYNSAVARGAVPPPLTAPAPPPIQPANGMNSLASFNGSNLGNINGLIGEGGALTKAQREIYVGNLPPGVTSPQLTEFLNAALKQLGVANNSPNGSVISCWVSTDGHYAFAELRTVDEANASLTYLTGVQIGSFALKIGRPKGYAGPPVPSIANPLLSMGVTGLPGLLGGSGLGLGGLASVFTSEPLSNVIMVTNIPIGIQESDIKELFSPFGELKAFNVIKTPGDINQSAAMEYVNPGVTDGVVAGMNQLSLGEHKITVQRVPVSSAAVLLKSSAPSNENLAPVPVPDILTDYPPNTVIRLSNMTTVGDITDDSSYEELIEDVSDECNSYGTVLSIVVPRGDGTGKDIGVDLSVGQIFVQFSDVLGAQKCLQAVAGRKFNGRTVMGCFYPENLFVDKVYNLPSGFDVNISIAENNQHQNGDNFIDVKMDIGGNDSYEPYNPLEEENIADLD